MILLDLYRKAGDAAVGYRRAGFDVVGVDVQPQPRFPFEFHRADALEFLTGHDHEFDAVHASPPRRAWTLAAAGGVHRRPGHVELVEPTRRALRLLGAPYVIENVPGAPLVDPVTLCGTSFGLPVIRHRSFESSVPLTAPSCGYAATARVRHARHLTYPHGRKTWGPAWRRHVLPVVWPWMTLAEAGQAVPPAYTEHVGRQLAAHLRGWAAPRRVVRAGAP